MIVFGCTSKMVISPPFGSCAVTHFSSFFPRNGFCLLSTKMVTLPVALGVVGPLKYCAPILKYIPAAKTTTSTPQTIKDDLRLLRIGSQTESQNRTSTHTSPNTITKERIQSIIDSRPSSPHSIFVIVIVFPPYSTDSPTMSCFPLNGFASLATSRVAEVDVRLVTVA